MVYLSKNGVIDSVAPVGVIVLLCDQLLGWSYSTHMLDSSVYSTHMLDSSVSYDNDLMREICWWVQASVYFRSLKRLWNCTRIMDINILLAKIDGIMSSTDCICIAVFGMILCDFDVNLIVGEIGWWSGRGISCGFYSFFVHHTTHGLTIPSFLYRVQPQQIKPWISIQLYTASPLMPSTLTIRQPRRPTTTAPRSPDHLTSTASLPTILPGRAPLNTPSRTKYIHLYI